MGIEFLWHNHILELRSILTDAEARCFMCRLPVSAYNYRCDKCSFFLHISCLKLPIEATHPAHQEHPLTLLEAPQPIVDGQEVLCNDCGSPSSGFTYHCVACQFNLHLDCAVRKQTFKREVHKHPLTFLASPPNGSENFRCKVCGEIGYGFCLHCGSCQYVVHVECSVLPATISTKRHEHQFTLTQTNSIEGNSDEAYCDVCEEEANLEGSLYHCESCNYSAHLGCVISAPNLHVKFSYKDAEYSLTETMDRQEVESSDTNLNFGIQFGQSDDGALVQLRHWFKEHRMMEFGSTGCPYSVSVFHTQNESSTDDNKLPQAGQRHNEASFEGNDVGELPSNSSHVKQLGNVVKLEHFSHQHPLILNDEHKGEVNCFGCLRSISSLAYSCNQCNYFLHEWCAMLPHGIKHPLHPYHTLTLLERAPNFFGCEACKIPCDSFTYNCRFCSFSLHLECASIPSTIKSEVHQHLLTLRPRRANFTGCMACGEDYVVATFQCDECSIKVDFPCALLPHKVRHKCHVHPFTLKYSHVEDDSDEFYCDFCEKRRDPKLWIYYCEECDYIAHTKCLTAELFEYVQSSGLVQHDHHKHILNLIMNSPPAPQQDFQGFSCFKVFN